MSYFSEIEASMTKLARNPVTRFVGYGLLAAKAARGLANVPDDQIVETPTAENLMLGVAIGLSLRGLRPLVIFERMDFLLNAADALVNHLDKIEEISCGEFAPRVLIRCIVGNRRAPLFTGATHMQDLTRGFRHLCRRIDVITFSHAKYAISEIIAGAAASERSQIFVEYKDLYGQ